MTKAKHGLRACLLATLLACAFATGGHPLALPADPATACNAPAVDASFAACSAAAGGGNPVSSSCCAQLDAAFHDPASPQAGCLCHPQVLYGAMARLAGHDVNVLAVLQQCASSHGMRASWALQRPGGACPKLGLGEMTAPVEVLLASRPASPFLLNSTRPTWAWTNLLQAGDYMAQMPRVMSAFVDRVLGLRCLQMALLSLMLVAPLFGGLHHAVLMPLSATYRAMDGTSRLITCQHAVYALVFGLQLGPQTVMSVRAFFRLWTPAYAFSDELSILVGIIIMARAALYMVEACVRSVAFNWLLVLHHGLYFSIFFVGLWTQNVPALLMGLVLDLFAAHEVFLYIVLIGYRLHLDVRFTTAMLWLGCGWYALTRLVQSAMLATMIVGWSRNPAVNRTPAFLFTTVLCGAFTVIQAYTLVIYHGIGQRVRNRAAAPAAGGAAVAKAAVLPAGLLPK